MMRSLGDLMRLHHQMWTEIISGRFFSVRPATDFYCIYPKPHALYLPAHKKREPGHRLSLPPESHDVHRISGEPRRPCRCFRRVHNRTLPLPDTIFSFIRTLPSPAASRPKPCNAEQALTQFLPDSPAENPNQRKPRGLCRCFRRIHHFRKDNPVKPARTFIRLHPGGADDAG